MSKFKQTLVPVWNFIPSLQPREARKASLERARCRRGAASVWPLIKQRCGIHRFQVVCMLVSPLPKVLFILMTTKLDWKKKTKTTNKLSEVSIGEEKRSWKWELLRELHVSSCKVFICYKKAL